MLSAKTIYGEIFDNDEAFRLFCSIAASGEAQGGWENGRIATLVPGSQAIFDDEDNHLACCHEELLRLAAAGHAQVIRGVYACERLGGWRRMVALRMPARRNALGSWLPAHPRQV